MGPHPTLGCRCFCSRSPANDQSVSRVRVSTPSEAVSIWGITVFVPGLSEWLMHGWISEQWMGTYPPRVHRDRAIHPSVILLARAALLDWPRVGRRGVPRAMGLGLRSRWDDSFSPIALYLPKQPQPRQFPIFWSMTNIICLFALKQTARVVQA